MTYIERIVRQLASLIPDCPEELLRVYALLVLTTGENTTRENVHDAWAVWRMTTKPEHPALVPFDVLTLDVQELDEPYAEAIRKVSVREI